MSERDAPPRLDDAEVIAFADAELATGERGTVAIDLNLRSGDFAVVNGDDPATHDALIDAICGLAPVRAERRSVLGRDWGELGADRANALRGRIGCASTAPMFPSRMTVGESVTLAPRFHDRRDDDAVWREAARLARSFGLPGVPMTVPGALRQTDLIRADCVRALLGAPDLLIVDERRAFPREIALALVNGARGVCMRGGAVLWITSVQARAHDARLPASQVHEMRDGRIRAVAPEPTREVG